jgi:hypothetical protein
MKASGLEALQLALQRHVLGEASGIEAAIAPGPGPGAAIRLDIYRYAHRARLVDALRDSYGHTASYLGAEAFDRIAAAYVQAHPSRHANIRWYGGELAAWIERRHAGTPEVAELAALDWALRRAFDGPDAIPMDLGALSGLAALDCDGMRLALHPTAERLRLRYNTVAIWHALDEGLAPPAAVRLPEVLELLVWRRGEQPHFRSLGEIEAAALGLAAKGWTFGEICTELARAFPRADVAVEAGTLLRRWVEDELLVATPS